MKRFFNKTKESMFSNFPGNSLESFLTRASSNNWNSVDKKENQLNIELKIHMFPSFINEFSFSRAFIE
jgi:hypothetical protein